MAKGYNVNKSSLMELWFSDFVMLWIKAILPCQYQDPTAPTYTWFPSLKNKHNSSLLQDFILVGNFLQSWKY